ncbi:Ribonuclease H domain [Dillenia turbinata]|uniref:Ribonuclease H domain n=1 Tax=Dillenia turbinata TaxID=194707 RepID=A0AAN8UUQ4_9MAGN
MAELWGLREGLIIAEQKMLTNIEVESDSQFLVEALSKGIEKGHPLELLIQECRAIMKALIVAAMRHILREANKCADKLAKLGRRARPGLTDLDIPPPEMYELLRQDADGVKWIRKIRVLCCLVRQDSFDSSSGA